MIKQPKILGGIVVLTALFVGLSIFWAGRHVPITATLVASEKKLSLDEPLTVRFNFPVNRRALVPQINPPLEGSWEWQGGALGGRLARTVTFTPDTGWLPDQSYQVTFAGVGPVLAEQPEQTVAVTATTASLPVIVAASIEENAEDVPSDSTIDLTLDQPINQNIDFSFRLEPEADLVVEQNPTTRQYSLKPAAPLAAGQSYKLIAERELVFFERTGGTVVKRGEKQKVFERLFRVKTPPKITAFSPNGESVLPSQKTITIEFSAPMNRSSVESAITISPRPTGEWRWGSDRQLIFDIHEALSLDTSYVVTLPATIKDQTEDPLTEAMTLSFRTVGSLRLLAAVPNKKSGVSITTPIKLTFDQRPVAESVTERLSFTPAAAVQFEQSGSSLLVKPVTAWEYNTKYTMTLRAGAVGEFNRPSKAESIVSFTTEEKVVLLNIAWDRQDRALSCEAAALKMALAGKGVRVSEDDIMAQIGYDPTLRTGGGWGDPDVAFVGDINGAQNTTGYGVHWDPIARAARVWRNAKAVTGLTLQAAARELEAGNPIVIWGVTGSAYADPWVTPSGKRIDAWKGEHARTLIGFRGSVDNPTSFIINDPLSGRVTWTAAKLRSNWATFSNAGVVVY